MQLMLESAHAIIERDPMFRVPRRPMTRSEMAKFKESELPNEKEQAAEPAPVHPPKDAIIL